MNQKQVTTRKEPFSERIQLNENLEGIYEDQASCHNLKYTNPERDYCVKYCVEKEKKAFKRATWSMLLTFKGNFENFEIFEEELIENALEVLLPLLKKENDKEVYFEKITDQSMENGNLVFEGFGNLIDHEAEEKLRNLPFLLLFKVRNFWCEFQVVKPKANKNKKNTKELIKWNEREHAIGWTYRYNAHASIEGRIVYSLIRKLKPVKSKMEELEKLHGKDLFIPNKKGNEKKEKRTEYFFRDKLEQYIEFYETSGEGLAKILEIFPSKEIQYLHQEIRNRISTLKKYCNKSSQAEWGDFTGDRTTDYSSYPKLHCIDIFYRPGKKDKNSTKRMYSYFNASDDDKELLISGGYQTFPRELRAAISTKTFTRVDKEGKEILEEIKLYIDSDIKNAHPTLLLGFLTGEEKVMPGSILTESVESRDALLHQIEEAYFHPFKKMEKYSHELIHLSRVFAKKKKKEKIEKEIKEETEEEDHYSDIYSESESKSDSAADLEFDADLEVDENISKGTKKKKGSMKKRLEKDLEDNFTVGELELLISLLKKEQGDALMEDSKDSLKPDRKTAKGLMLSHTYGAQPGYEWFRFKLLKYRCGKCDPCKKETLRNCKNVDSKNCGKCDPCQKGNLRKCKNIDSKNCGECDPCQKENLRKCKNVDSKKCEFSRQCAAKLQKYYKEIKDAAIYCYDNNKYPKELYEACKEYQNKEERTYKDDYLEKKLRQQKNLDYDNMTSEQKSKQKEIKRRTLKNMFNSGVIRKVQKRHLSNILTFLERTILCKVIQELEEEGYSVDVVIHDGCFIRNNKNIKNLDELQKVTKKIEENVRVFSQSLLGHTSSISLKLEFLDSTSIDQKLKNWKAKQMEKSTKATRSIELEFNSDSLKKNNFIFNSAETNPLPEMPFAEINSESHQISNDPHYLLRMLEQQSMIMTQQGMIINQLKMEVEEVNHKRERKIQQQDMKIHQLQKEVEEVKQFMHEKLNDVTLCKRQNEKGSNGSLERTVDRSSEGEEQEAEEEEKKEETEKPKICFNYSCKVIKKKKRN